MDNTIHVWGAILLIGSLCGGIIEYDLSGSFPILDILLIHAIVFVGACIGMNGDLTSSQILRARGSRGNRALNCNRKQGGE
jgi:hypothetical protein